MYKERKLRVAVIYKKSNIFFSGHHFDMSLYYFILEALKRNNGINVTYFPTENNFDATILKNKFDVILLPDNTPWGLPENIEGMKEMNIPVIAKCGDPHEVKTKKFDPYVFHERYKIDYYFNFMPSYYFYKFYPKEFKYKEIFWCLEADLYKNTSPFKERIKDKILLSGNVGKPSWKSKIANRMLNPDNSAHYLYKLRTECRKLQYVEFTPMKDGKHINSDYPSYLSKYSASIAAGTFYPVIKYFEIPAAGCLTFMEVTEKNHCKILGFEDGKNVIFINENNYKEKFMEFLDDKDNPKWENIAKAGREYVLEKLNNDVAVEKIVKLMQELVLE